MSDTRHDAALHAAYQTLKTIPSFDTTTVVTVSMAVAAAVEAALAWKSEPLADPLRAALVPHGTWSCGCSSRECMIRWDTFQNGAVLDPGASVRATCIRHSLIANADTDGTRSLTAARALAMARLDALHAEQCR